MNVRTWAIVVVAAAALGACGGDFGPGVPECRDDFRVVGSATIVQVQAVPSAEWGPCIEDMKVGWEYVPQQAKQGEAVFAIDSDRHGIDFLRVSLVPACDLAGATDVGEVVPGINRYERVHEETGPVRIVVIPVAPRHHTYASTIVNRLTQARIEGRGVAPELVSTEGALGATIEAELRSGAAVMIVDDREEADQTVELRRSGEGPEFGLSLEDALDELADDVEDPRYKAEWFHVFDGGCIVYDIDAHGQGAGDTIADIDDALHFYPLGELRREAESAGLVFAG